MAGDTLLRVRVIADTGQAESAFNQLGSRAQQIGQSLESVGNSLTVGVSLPLAAAGAAAFTWAVGTEEATNKVNVVFGDSGQAIIDFADTAAENLGISSLAALDAAGTIGNLFRAMEIGEAPAAAMSQQIITLAGDLASFNNADPTQVLQALQSGLVGQVEPLRQFGVNLTEARLKEEALTLGLWDGVGALDAGAKAQAAFSIIMQDTALAQGDFARTADGAANQIRTFWAEVQNLGAELGTVLVPIVQDIVGALSSLVGWFSDLSPAVQTTVVYMAALAAAMGPLLSITGRMIQFGSTLNQAFKLIGISAGAAGLAFTALTVVIGSVILAHQQHKQSIDDLVGSMEGLEGAAAQAALTQRLVERGISDVGVAAAIAAVAHGTATEAQREMIESNTILSIVADDATEAVAAQAEAEVVLTAATIAGGKAMADSTAAALGLHQGVQEVTGAVSRLAPELTTGAAASRDIASAQADVHAKFDAATASMRNQASALLELTSPVFAAIESESRLAEAQTTLNDLQATGTATADELAQASLDVTSAYLENKAAQEQLRNTPGAIDAFNSAGAAARGARGQVDGLAGALADVEGRLDRINGKVVTFTVDGKMTVAANKAATFLDGRS